MGIPPRRLLVLAAGAMPVICAPTFAQQADQTLTLPTIEIISTTPVTGTGLELSDIPAAVNSISAAEFEKQSSPSVVDTMLLYVPSVSTANQSGNSFEPDLQFRGFVATPLTGTPIGLAVYQNGVRINEAFGDMRHECTYLRDAVFLRPSQARRMQWSEVFACSEPLPGRS